MTDFDVMRHLTDREDTRKPQRIAYIKPLGLQDFRTLAAQKSSLVTYVLTPQGFEVYITTPQHTFQLYTFRHKARCFKCADTAIRFAMTLGLKRVLWDGLENYPLIRPGRHNRRSSNGTP